MGFLTDPRFQRRLMLYLFGILIGSLLVVVFFKDRFPDAPTDGEVRKSFKEDSLVIAEPVRSTLDSLGLPPNEFKARLGEGKFILPTRRDPERKKFYIRTEEDPRMKVRLEVLDEERTEATSLTFSE